MRIFNFVVVLFSILVGIGIYTFIRTTINSGAEAKEDISIEEIKKFVVPSRDVASAVQSLESVLNYLGYRRIDSKVNSCIRQVSYKYPTKESNAIINTGVCTNRNLFGIGVDRSEGNRLLAKGIFMVLRFGNELEVGNAEHAGWSSTEGVEVSSEDGRCKATFNKTTLTVVCRSV